MSGGLNYVHVVEHPTLDDLFYKLAAEGDEQFMRNVRLATTPRQQQILAPQTIHGHAMNGDMEFYAPTVGQDVHHQYVNSTISDVIQAKIEHNPNFGSTVEEIQTERYELIEQLKGWITEAIGHICFNKNYSSYNPRKLQDSHGYPLMGIELFNHTTITNPENILRGIYLGSRLDSAYWREQTENYFKVNHNIKMHMHKGLCTAGNIEHIKEHGLSISKLSRISDMASIRNGFDAEITEILKDYKIIVDFSKRGSKKNASKV